MRQRFPVPLLVALFAAALALVPPAFAQAPDDEAPVSQCLAVAQGLPNVIYASTDSGPLSVDGDVTITFAGHSTYRIETPAGVTIATDYSGVYGHTPTPRVITMNRAHSTHYTLNPDPAIEYVFAGWDETSPDGADHDAVIDDVYIRNVTTDIRRWGSGGLSANQNSIFIFEVAGLCIGHLGHLHHALTEDHYAMIGRLDILMVPVDGGLTLSHEGMAEITTRLRSSIVLPMHLRGRVIDRFIDLMGADWSVDFLDGDEIVVNVRSLPRRPTIMVPHSLASRG
ncbi:MULTISPECIES: MBL fold metallo-hydrolase [unclassified Roseitalea]|uniref:MBL fold metallo-hydrolase n=1 Tax=unclassified Roseitalea TaxID=2639107 RepID=UPI00273D536E|nr:MULTISPECIES: MBL fold metallo-hydrolase [unclassified Roseitalea]